MSDILIKGMEMPKDQHTITITLCHDGYTVVEFRDRGSYPKSIEVYETVHLPEKHGRLIDADAFEDAFIRYYLSQERDNHLMFAAVEIKQHLADMIGEWPTIIEASE